MINDLRNMDYIELICDAEDEDSINVCVQIDDNHDIRIIFNRVFRGGSGMRRSMYDYEFSGMWCQE